ncbi:hypothetical protein BCY89_26595 [Sphingobacterium siyangense]|uniref:Leucine rich repeat (LRR) protein n=1 Tax=Sphingobacterium siyangense TaxID=459529 RepID=A0A420G171_9SPHI|nr:hypothetical protein [Sphingobacterium siyangense]RKF38918.1 hypothetical protein BCY89_26595 [Sphingobacterium siyangense]
MHQLFLCQFKGEEFLSISSFEEVMAIVERYKPENWHEFEKYLRRDDPPGYNEYFAELYDGGLPFDKRNLKSLTIDRYKDKALNNLLFEQLQHFQFQKIIFSESLLDIELPKNVLEVRQLFCNGKSTKGTIDLNKYSMLEEIHILGFNKSIKFENQSNSVKHITLWYFNPTSRSIESILDAFPNVEEILIHHTNVQSLEGIEKLKNLKKLEISYGRNLQSVKNVNECEHIAMVIFNNCRKIDDFEQIEKSPDRTVLHTRFPG